LSFALERIGPLAEITITFFYLLILYLLALPNTAENPFASIYNESLIKTTCQHLLLLVGFDTLIYQKYYDTPPILVGHHRLGPPLASPLRLYRLPENLKLGGGSQIDYATSAGRKTHREKALWQAEICQENSFPDEEIVPIVTAIELGFIGIIISIIITSTFIS
jgi:hypothetical protein